MTSAGIGASAAGQHPAFALQGALSALGLCLLVAISYFPAIGAGFVWDDAVLTEARPLRSLSGLWQIWLNPASLEQYEGHYWPLLYTTFWLEHRLWGLAPLGYHIVNLLLHMAVTTLLWRLLLRLEVAGAWVAAAVFAVHPLHTESVAWVIGRKDILAALFSVACVLYYLRFIEDGRRGNYIRALLLYPAALLCKSVAVTLPVSLLIWHWWKQGRVLAADVRRILPLLLLGLLITITDWWFYKAREIISFDYSLIERVLIAARALWFYVGQLVWPAELAAIYPRWEVGTADLAGWVCLIAALAAAAALWFARRRTGRGPLAAALFFVVTLSPTLGFVDYGHMQFSFVADRYQYLAGIGMIAMLVGTATCGVSKLSGARGISVRTMAATVTVALLATLGTASWRQAAIYRDNGTFFEHIISLNPRARDAHHNLGLWYQKQGRVEEALAAYRIARALRPDFADIPNKIGTAFEELGQRQKAEQNYRHALQLNPHYTLAMNNLALLLTRQNRYEEGLELYGTVIKIDPEYADAHTGMGVALFQLHRPEEALRSFDRALALDPSLKEARTNREHVLQNLKGKEK